ncbi:MAG: PAS domain S-box protein, partial [Armatimonadota bacterium]
MLTRSARKVLLLTVAAAASVWLFDAFFAAAVADRGSLLDLLVLAIPTRELLHRLALVAIILIVGGILAYMTAARDRANQHTRDLNSVLRTMRELNQVMVQEHEIDAILKSACHALVSERNVYDDCWIAYFDRHGKFTEIYNARPTPQHERVRQQLSEGHLTRCVRMAQETDDILMVEDVSDACANCPLAEVYEHDCALIAPVKRGDRMYGVLCVSADRRFVDDADEQALVLEAANDIALGLTVAASERQVRHLNAVLGAVRDVNQLIVRERDPDTLLQESCEILTSARRPYTTCWIALLQENEERVQVFQAGIDEHSDTFQRWLRENDSSCMECLRRSGRPVVLIDEAADCGDCPLAQVRGEQSALVAPIQREGHTYGYLGITIESEFGESAEEQGLIVEAANDLALGLHMAATEQQRDEAFENLREREHRFRTALSEAPFPTMLHAEDGEVLMINELWTEITGYSHADIPTIADWTEKAYGERRSTMRAEINRLYATEGRVDEGEYTVRTASGDQRIWHFTSAAVGQSSDGRRLVLSMASDITERKCAEARIESLSRFPSENPNPVLRVNSDGTVIYANDSATRLLDELGSGLEKQVPNGWNQTLQQEIDDGQSRSLEVKCRGRSYAFTCAPIPEEGYTNLYGLDITEREWAEEELQRSAEKFQTLFHRSGDAIFIHDMDGHFVQVNDTACGRLGYSRRKLVEMGIHDIDAPESLENMDDRIKEIRKHGQLIFESIHIAQDGTHIPVEINAQFIEYNGEPHVLSIARDITERKKAEQAIRESEARYRAVFENTGTAMCIIEEDRTVALANEQFAELYGPPLEQIQGNIDFVDFIAPHEVERMMAYHEARRKPDAVAPNRYEFDFIRADGQQRRILLTVDIIPGTRRSVASLLDITEREQMERELRRSEALFRSVFESIQDMFYRTDAEGRIVLISPSVSHYSDIPPGDFIGRTITDFWLHPDQRDEMLRIIKEEGEVQDFETVLENEKGERFVVSITSRAMYDESGDFAGVQGVFRDITERKEAEQERERYLNELQLINEVIVEASRMADVHEMCHLIAEAIRSVNEGAYVGVSLYDPTTSRVRIRSLVGAEDMIEKALEKFGGGLDTFTAAPERMGEDSPWFTSGKLERVPEGIHGLMGGIFPADVCKEIEEMANIESVYTVGF